MHSLRSAWRGIQPRGEETAWLAEAATATEQLAAEYLEEVLTRFPCTEKARCWLSTKFAFEVQDLCSVRVAASGSPTRTLFPLHCTVCGGDPRAATCMAALAADGDSWRRRRYG